MHAGQGIKCFSMTPPRQQFALGTDLQLLIDTLQAVDGRVQAPDFVASQLELLLEVVHLILVRLALGSVLCLELALKLNRVHQRCAKQADTSARLP